MNPQEALEAAIMATDNGRGNANKLAKLLGISAEAIYQWVRRGYCSDKRVLDLERLSGVSRYLLRPDRYGDDPNERNG